MATLKFGTRRDFLSLLGLTAAGQVFGSLLKPSAAWAIPGPVGPSNIEIFIKVFLNGGVDGLALVPPKDPVYYNALLTQRPTLLNSSYLSNPNQVLNLGGPFGLHPYLGPNCPIYTAQGGQLTTMSAQSLKSIYDMIIDGDGKVLPRIGFPAPDLNHPSAVDPWNIGYTSFDRASALHWEARLMAQGGYNWNQMWLFGSPGGMVPYRPAAGQTAPIATRFLKQITRYSVNDWDGWRRGQELGGSAEVLAAQSAIEQLMQLPEPTNAPVPLRRYRQKMRESLNVVDSVAPILNVELPAYFPQYLHPDGFDECIRDVAKVIHHYRIVQGQSVKLMFHVGMNGFDTHGQTGATQDDLLIPRLVALNQCMGALNKFLVANNLWNKTAIQFVSEFGRGIIQDPLGTPHGHASNLFVLGGTVNSALPSVIGGTTLLPTTADLATPVIHGGSAILTSRIDPRDVTWEIIQGLGENPANVITGYSPQRQLNLFA